MKYLIVGDVHAQASDLDDCRALIDRVCEVLDTIEEHVIVLFMGDQYNDHAIINAEVLKFWCDSFKRLKDKHATVYALTGNHDTPGSTFTGANAMLAHVDQITVIDRPMSTGTSTGFVPYIRDQAEFVAACNKLDAKLIFAHQSFTGAQFENGFYDPSGIDQELIKQKAVISGHIHLAHTIGKVTYVGSPRWRTRSDANIDKAIWLYDIVDGVVLSKQAFDTSTVCRKVWAFEDREDIGVAIQGLKKDDRVFVDIYGSEKYINVAKEFYGGLGYRLRAFKTDKTVSVIKESDGIENAWSKWTESYKPKHATDLEILKTTAYNRIAGQE